LWTDADGNDPPWAVRRKKRGGEVSLLTGGMQKKSISSIVIIIIIIIIMEAMCDFVGPSFLQTLFVKLYS
jgi:hypothetical protein